MLTTVFLKIFTKKFLGKSHNLCCLTFVSGFVKKMETCDVTHEMVYNLDFRHTTLNKNILLPITDGSKSTKTALGTCFPAPVSLKKVLKESSPPPIVLSDGICPSGWIPCSKQYNSQHALPIWQPA